MLEICKRLGIVGDYYKGLNDTVVMRYGGELDEKNKLVTGPAYMLAQRISEVFDGIADLVRVCYWPPGVNTLLGEGDGTFAVDTVRIGSAHGSAATDPQGSGSHARCLDRRGDDAHRRVEQLPGVGSRCGDPVAREHVSIAVHHARVELGAPDIERGDELGHGVPS